MNSRIFELANRGFVDELQTKWWNREQHKLKCTEHDDEADEISVDNIGGLFILILIGISISVLAIAMEFFWFRYYKIPKIIVAPIMLTNRRMIRRHNSILAKMNASLKKKYEVK